MTPRIRRLLGSDGLSGRFLRYLVIGGSAAVIDLGGFVLLMQTDLRTPVAAAASFAVAAVWNFTLSSVVVFRLGSTWRRFGLFMAFALVGLVLNTGATTLAAVWLPEVLAKITGIGLAFGANFWMNNSLVFRRQP